MEYFILCFGRTKFTQYTVDAINAHASRPPKIFLCNNGWNSEAVPKEIYSVWQEFVSEYTSRGKVYKVLDVGSRAQPPLDCFKIAEEYSGDDFYFISDNDCIVATCGFDEILLDKASTNKLNKLGADFFRTITIDHALSFDPVRNDADSYYFDMPNGRICPNESAMETFCDSTKTPQKHLIADEQITNNIVDTTLSIVRRGHPVAQSSNNRFSMSCSAIRMLHVGYLEENFGSRNKLDVMEMLYYFDARSKNVSDYRDDYERRRDSYHRFIESRDPALYRQYSQIVGPRIRS